MSRDVVVSWENASRHYGYTFESYAISPVPRN